MNANDNYQYECSDCGYGDVHAKNTPCPIAGIVAQRWRIIMDDLISKTAALDAIDGMKPMKDNTEQLFMQALCWVAVKTVPNVDAAPVVHGQWIDYKDDHQCSACKEHVFLDTYVWKAIPFKFCPNCGAKMENNNE